MTKGGIALFGGALAVVALGAYYAGRLHTAPPAPERQPQVAAPAPKAPAPNQGGRAKIGVLKNAVRFRFDRINVKALMSDGDIMWIGTSRGLIKHMVKSGKQTIYDNKRELLSNGVFYLGKRGPEIWVGTYGGGLSVFNPESAKWRNYNIPNGMADAFVYDALHTKSGDVWIATWSGANQIVKGNMDDINSWRLHTVESTGGGLPNDWVYALAEGRNGEIWMATEGGLARFRGGKWDNWQHKDGLGAPYRLVEADIQFKTDPGKVSAHHARQKVEQGLEDVKVAYNPNYVVSLAVDGAGNVWAGTWGGGLSRFDGANWKTFTVRDGLPGNHVFALDTDAKGNLWIGTSRGLAKYDGSKFVLYRQKDGLVSDVVFSIDMLEDGSAWIGSFGGVSWFPRGLTDPVQAK